MVQSFRYFIENFYVGYIVLRLVFFYQICQNFRQFCLGENMSRSAQKKKLEDYLEEPMKNAEVIELSRFPDNSKYETERVAPIEREDFPAPPATAAAYPELCKLLCLHGSHSIRIAGEIG